MPLFPQLFLGSVNGSAVWLPLAVPSLAKVAPCACAAVSVLARVLPNVPFPTLTIPACATPAGAIAAPAAAPATAAHFAVLRTARPADRRSSTLTASTTLVTRPTPCRGRESGRHTGGSVPHRDQSNELGCRKTRGSPERVRRATPRVCPTARTRRGGGRRPRVRTPSFGGGRGPRCAVEMADRKNLTRAGGRLQVCAAVAAECRDGAGGGELRCVEPEFDGRRGGDQGYGRPFLPPNPWPAFGLSEINGANPLLSD